MLQTYKGIPEKEDPFNSTTLGKQQINQLYLKVQ